MTVLLKLHLIEEGQRSVKEIRQQIERYEKRNLELVSKWPEGMPEYVQTEIKNTDIKIIALNWTLYDD